MRVERVELSGIGPFEDAVFDFGPEPKGEGELVLFEGPNGSGKTTVLELLASSAPDAMSANGGFGRRFTRDDGVAAITTVHGAEKYMARRRPNVMGEGAFGPHLLGPGGRAAWAAFAYNSHQPRPQIATAGPRDIHVDPYTGALFGQPQDRPGEPMYRLLGQVISNLHFDVLQADYDTRQNPAAAQEIAGRREVLETTRARYDNVLSSVLDCDANFVIPPGQRSPELRLNGVSTPIETLAEGLASLLAWVTDLLLRLHHIAWVETARSPLDQEFLLLLDEVDQPLHPTLQAKILPTVRRLFPRARIYASTHSPFVVASVGEGVVFPIRPGKDHRVRGAVERRALAPGESLELVTSDIFRAPIGFVDQPTVDGLRAHRADIDALRKGHTIDWDAFVARRMRLFALNDEVKTAVAIEEVPVRDRVHEELRRRADAAE